MDEKLKRRLVGATVLVSLVVIFVPMLLEEGPVLSTSIDETNIPARPDTEFSSRVMPVEDETLDSLPEDTDTAPVEIDRSGDGEQTEEGQNAAGDAEEVPAASSEQPEESTELREGISAWVVQVGSFSKLENAKKVEQDLQKGGFPAFVENVELNGKVLYRVLVGPEVDKKRAEKMIPKLDPSLEKLKLKGKLRRYP